MGGFFASQPNVSHPCGRARLPPAPAPFQLAPVVDALHGAQRPVLYVGGGCLDAAPELRELVARTGVPVAQTLMGLGTFPASDPLALQARPYWPGRCRCCSCSTIRVCMAGFLHLGSHLWAWAPPAPARSVHDRPGAPKEYLCANWEGCLITHTCVPIVQMHMGTFLAVHPLALHACFELNIKAGVW